MSRRMPLVAVLLVALLLPPLWFPGTAMADGAESTSVLIRTGKVSERELFHTVSAFGTIQPDPDRVLSLSFPHGGLVNRVWVRQGQRVQRGARLVELVARPADRMEFLQGESAVAYAEREYKRQRRLFAEHLATRAQLAAARKALRDARATLASLRSQGKGQASLVLRTPTDGIVTRVDVQAGQRVGAGATALLVAAEDELVAVLGVEPEDVDAVKPGAAVQLSSVFVPSFHASAKVREVHAMIDPATQLVDVLVPLPGRDLDHLVIGSHVEGRIQLSAHRGLTVPRSAVLQDEHGWYLFTVQDGHAHRVAVTPLLTAGNRVEVKGALHAGERIVTLGNYELHDGGAVREAAP